MILFTGRDACLFFVDGFCKDELMQKLLQYFIGLKPEDIPADAHGMSKEFLPTIEADLGKTWDEIITALMSGQTILMLEGFDKCLLIDSRTYPARSVSEPEKEKAFRDILLSVKKNSYEYHVAHMGADVGALAQAIEGKKALEELAKAHISLD